MQDAHCRLYMYIIRTAIYSKKLWPAFIEYEQWWLRLRDHCRPKCNRHIVHSIVACQQCCYAMLSMLINASRIIVVCCGHVRGECLALIVVVVLTITRHITVTFKLDSLKSPHVCSVCLRPGKLSIHQSRGPKRDASFAIRL